MDRSLFLYTMSTQPRIREIIQLGQPILHEVALAIDDVHSVQVQTLVADMLATFDAGGMIGLAAPQIGAAMRMILVASRPIRGHPVAPVFKRRLLINPELLFQSPETETGWEGCASIPGIRGMVTRAKSIKIRFQDTSGISREEEWSGLPARVFQHEFDHLNAVMFLDHVSGSRKICTEQEFRRWFPQ